MKYEPKILKLEGCEKECGFDNFLKIVTPLLPTDWNKECHADAT